MNRELELCKRHGTRVLLIVVAIWGLAVAVAAEAGAFGAIYPLMLAALIALGIVVPVVVYAISDGFRAPKRMLRWLS